MEELYSETGIGHLLFEQAEKIRHLEDALDRWDEAVCLVEWSVAHNPLPMVPKDAVLGLLGDVVQRGNCGIDQEWMARVRKIMREDYR